MWSDRDLLLMPRYAPFSLLFTLLQIHWPFWPLKMPSPPCLKGLWTCSSFCLRFFSLLTLRWLLPFNIMSQLNAASKECLFWSLQKSYTLYPLPCHCIILFSSIAFKTTSVFFFYTLLFFFFCLSHYLLTLFKAGKVLSTQIVQYYKTS